MYRGHTAAAATEVIIVVVIVGRLANVVAVAVMQKVGWQLVG